MCDLLIESHFNSEHEIRCRVTRCRETTNKLLEFAALCLALTLELSKEGIDQALITNSLEKQYKKYKNFNEEVDVRCNNNRLLHLIPDWHHATHME